MGRGWGLGAPTAPIPGRGCMPCGAMVPGLGPCMSGCCWGAGRGRGAGARSIGWGAPGCWGAIGRAATATGRGCGAGGLLFSCATRAFTDKGSPALASRGSDMACGGPQRLGWRGLSRVARLILDPQAVMILMRAEVNGELT
jgi:hypothetical protein